MICGADTKVGDLVEYLGASSGEFRWGGNDDPRDILHVGEVYVVDYVEVHSWHTKLGLKEVPGKFNSVSFKEVCSGEK